MAFGPTYRDGHNVWKVDSLWKASSDILREKVDPESLISDIRDVVDNWLEEGQTTFTAKELKEHLRRINDADFYPILVGPGGEILDGYHRLCKALIMEKPLISIKRFKEMPKPDYVIGEERVK